MKFSIIIINYKTKDITRDCLESILYNCDGDYEIILVDNNSSDASVNYLRQSFGDRIKIIENKSNFGFAKANNIGVKEAKGDYLFFLNSDTILHNNILKDFKDFIDKQSNIGIIAPKLMLEEQIEQKRAYGSFPNVFNIILDKFKKDKLYTEDIFEVDWVSGAAFVMKKDIFLELGGFDENYFMYFEDVDLCKRIKALGLKIMVNRNIFLTHLGGKSISKSNVRKEHYYNSQDYYFKKNYGIIVMLLIKIIRLPFKIIKQILN
jgi:GT2 family glycosyltransferase